MRAHHKLIVGIVVAVITSASSAAVWAISSNSSATAPVSSTTSSSVVDASTTTVDANAPEAVADSTTSTIQKPAYDIAAIQQKLTDLGYWNGNADGKAGQATAQAVMAFQKLHGLARSGQIDEPTVSALATADRPTPASSTGTLIEVDKKHQVIFFVRDGQTQWVFNTSTGTEKTYNTNGHKGLADTPAGTYKTSRTVDAVDKGPLGDLYRPRYFTNTGIAIHGAASIPAYPASHGCARVSNAAMDYIWAQDLMPVGGTVWVYDDASSQSLKGATTSTVPPTTTTTSAPTTTSTSTTPTSATEATTSTTADPLA